jgi:hypothetical protein
MVHAWYGVDAEQDGASAYSPWIHVVRYHPRVARAVRRPHDFDSARAWLLHLYQSLVGLMGLPKARLIRVAADVGMQAESELSVSALDL